MQQGRDHIDDGRHSRDGVVDAVAIKKPTPKTEAEDLGSRMKWFTTYTNKRHERSRKVELVASKHGDLAKQDTEMLQSTEKMLQSTEKRLAYSG